MNNRPFRFLDLPQELRDEIYPYCFEPEFRQSTLVNIQPSYRIPILEAVGDPTAPIVDYSLLEETVERYCCQSSVHLGHQYTDQGLMGDFKPRFIEDGASIITYRIGDALSLLLVCKQIHQEIWPLLEKLYPLFDAAIDNHHMDSTDPVFLSLYAKARFIFDAGPDRAMNFFNWVPWHMRPLLHNVAFISTCTSEEPYDFWYQPNLEKMFWYDTRWPCEMCEDFPNLRSIAIEVPSSVDEYVKFHAHGATEMLSKMLLAGMIDVVRLLYRKRCLDESRSTDQTIIFEHFDRLNHAVPHAKEQHHPSFKPTDAPRRFNVVEVTPWTVGSHGTWFSEVEKMGRLVEITRYEGTELVKFPRVPNDPSLCNCGVPHD